MFHDVSLLDLLFRLSIFSILLYKCYLLVKQHFIPLLKTAVHDEHNHLTELLEKEKLLLSTHKRFESQIYQQKQMFTLLEQKVHQWHQSLAEAKRIAEADALEKRHKLRDKIAVQQQYLCTQEALRAIAPTVLAQAQTTLTHQYTGTKGHAHLQQIIATLTSSERL